MAALNEEIFMPLAMGGDPSVPISRILRDERVQRNNLVLRKAAPTFLLWPVWVDAHEGSLKQFVS